MTAKNQHQWQVEHNYRLITSGYALELTLAQRSDSQMPQSQFSGALELGSRGAVRGLNCETTE